MHERHNPKNVPSRLMCPDGRRVGRPQEEGMMSTAASFPSVRNQGLIGPVGGRNYF